MENHTVSRTWKLKVLAVLTIVATLSLGVFMYQGKNIILQVEDEITELVTFSHNIESFIEKEDILFEEGGYINIPLDTALEDNMHIIIRNPKPYTVTLGGMVGDVKSVHTKVEDILHELGIELGVKDYVIPSLDTKVGYGSNIEVFRVKEVLESEEISIPFEKILKDNKELEKGKTNLLQEGKEGLKKIESKKKYINGQYFSTLEESEVIVAEPLDHIIEKGTKEKAPVSRGASLAKESPKESSSKKSSTSNQRSGPSKDSASKVITMNASAYDASFASTGKRPGDKYHGITASGTQVKPGVVAVDPRVIPLGTNLYIESLDGRPDYGYARAEDTGGAIKGNKIDLYFETAGEVRSFGRRNVKVYILP